MKRSLLTTVLTLGLAAAASAGALTDLALPDALPAAAAVPVPERARVTVCVDPGHPNTFNAATDMVNGTNENRVNWQVGRRLERVLKEKGYDVIMTRNAELNYVENKDRAYTCNAARLAVHLHCESTPGTGFAVYYPDREGTYDYKDDAENGMKGPSVPVREASRTAALMMANGLKDGLAGSLGERGVFGDSRTAVGSRQGALTYSILSRIPTVTVEMLVLTNKKDAAFIKTEAGQEKMAAALAAGIGLYLAP